jgi:F-type H+-transporting ATPase subunit delta
MSRFRASPYARALEQVVRSRCPERAEEVLAQLEGVAAAVAQVPDLNRVLVTPMVDPERKSAILDEVLDALAVTEPARRLVHVVQRHYRMAQLAEIASAYRELVDRARGRTRARVEAAVTLSQTQRRKLVTALEQLTGGSVVAELVVRPELLAGFRVQVGSKVFDASLAGQLERLSETAARS